MSYNRSYKQTDTQTDITTLYMLVHYKNCWDHGSKKDKRA